VWWSVFQKTVSNKVQGLKSHLQLHLSSKKLCVNCENTFPILIKFNMGDQFLQASGRPTKSELSDRNIIWTNKRNSHAIKCVQILFGTLSPFSNIYKYQVEHMYTQPHSSERHLTCTQSVIQSLLLLDCGHVLHVSVLLLGCRRTLYCNNNHNETLHTDNTGRHRTGSSGGCNQTSMSTLHEVSEQLDF
jgi:hypothetical protein